jgi:predicted Zn-dependent protease
MVSLDTTLLRDRDHAGVPAYVPVLRHELGHLLGLDHIDDRGQPMYPTTGAVVTYQDGDLAGLARLGKGACAPWL